ncbi:MAG: amidohydrolase [Lautropia sp.]
MEFARDKFLGVRPQWLSLHDEPVLDPELPIIDAHHHLWDRSGWRYLLDEFVEDLKCGHNIVATVYVQCTAMYRRHGPPELSAVGETEFANGMAAMSASGNYGPTEICAGIVAYADLRSEAGLPRLLDAHAQRAGPRFKGIRQITAWDPEPSVNNPENKVTAGMLEDPRFRRGMAMLASRGLRFDAWVYHTQLPALTDLARAFPGVPIVLNHAGTPLGIGGHERDRARTLRDWARDLRELARCDNVFIKLGGLGMRTAGMGLAAHERPLDSQRLAELMRPVLEPCIEFFGARRCMFESNFPVDKASYSYRTCWNTFKRIAAGASPAERTCLFSGTAAAFYSLKSI